MRDIFRTLADAWPISVTYRNVLAPERCLRLQLDLCRTTHLWYFRTRGRYEPQWIRVIAHALEQADCFIDVGAHVGFFAMTMAQALPRKRVVALEPDPDNVRALREHLALNGLRAVEVHHCAAASAGRSGLFFRNPLNDGGGGLQQLEEYRSGDRRVPVRVYVDQHPEFAASVEVPFRRIDELVTDQQCVVKIDVEGAELDVLKSAERLLAAGRVQAAVVEVWGRHVDEVMEYLRQFDIDCFLPRRPHPLRRGDAIEFRIANVLCLGRHVANRNAFLTLLS